MSYSKQEIFLKILNLFKENKIRFIHRPHKKYKQNREFNLGYFAYFKHAIEDCHGNQIIIHMPTNYYNFDKAIIMLAHEYGHFSSLSHNKQKYIEALNIKDKCNARPSILISIDQARSFINEEIFAWSEAHKLLSDLKYFISEKENSSFQDLKEYCLNSHRHYININNSNYQIENGYNQFEEFDFNEIFELFGNYIKIQD